VVHDKIDYFSHVFLNLGAQESRVTFIQPQKSKVDAEKNVILQKIANHSILFLV
jgi:hypothetical protein